LENLKDSFFKSLLVAFSLLFFSSTLFADTLKLALENAYNNSDELLIQRMSIRESDEAVAQSVAAKRPTLSVNQNLSSGYAFSSSCSGFCNSKSANASLSAKMSVLDGGRKDLGIRIANTSLYADRVALIETEQDVLLSAVTAFMNMRRSLEFVALERNSVKLLKRQVQAARDRFEVGEITRTDISFAESRLEAAKGKLANQIGNLEISIESYKMAIGVAPGELKDPPPLPDLPKNLEIAKVSASRHHPAVLALQHAVEIADLQLDLTKFNYRPTFSLSGELSDSSKTGKISSNLSLGGSVVLYQGGARSSKERKALATVEKARINLLYQTRRIQQGVATRWAQLNIAKALISANKRQIRAAETAFKGVTDEAEFGLRTTLDILDAEQSLMAAKVQLASTRRDEYVAAYELLKSIGLLTVKNLNLDVKEYDVQTNYKKVKDAPSSSRFLKLDNLLRKLGK
jgi:outer membrane protein